MTFMIIEKFKQTLRNHNLFVTQERVRLFDELKNHSGPCSIAKLIKLTADSLDETTVYRNLKLFEEIGVTNRVYSGWKYSVELSDNFKAHHHHMSCAKCGMVISFEESESLLGELKNIENKHGFRSESHILELVGVCQSCQKN